VFTLTSMLGIGTKAEIKAGAARGARVVEAILTFFALFGGAIVASGQSDYFPPVVGWVLLAISAAVLIVEMRRWVKIVPALFVYQMLVVLNRLFFGHSTFGATKLETTWLALLYVAIAVVSATVALRELNRLDRVFVMAFVGFFLWGFVAMPTSGIRSGLLKISCGLGCLLVAWANNLISGWRTRSAGGSLDRNHPN